MQKADKDHLSARQGLEKRIELIRFNRNELFDKNAALQSELDKAKEAMEFDDCIIRFAKRMQYKLDKNKNKDCPIMNPDGKGRGWSHCAKKWLRGRIRDEWYELGRALGTGDSDKISNECADIANFAMMIFDNISVEQALASESAEELK